MWKILGQWNPRFAIDPKSCGIDRFWLFLPDMSYVARQFFCLSYG